MKSCPAVAPEVATPVASPRRSVKLQATTVEITDCETRPKPTAAMPP